MLTWVAEVFKQKLKAGHELMLKIFLTLKSRSYRGQERVGQVQNKESHSNTSVSSAKSIMHHWSVSIVMMCWWTLLNDHWHIFYKQCGSLFFFKKRKINPAWGTHSSASEKIHILLLTYKNAFKGYWKKEMDHANLVFGNKNVGFKWPHAL